MQWMVLNQNHPCVVKLPFCGIRQHRQSKTSHTLGNGYDHTFDILCSKLHTHRRRGRKFAS